MFIETDGVLAAKTHSCVERGIIKDLIQELIDQIIDPDTFHRRLEEAIKITDSFQLYHFAFLENHVTELRKSLVSGEIWIRGIISPANNVAQPKSIIDLILIPNDPTITSQTKASSSGKRTETTSNTVSNNSIGTQIQHPPMVNYRKPLFDQSNGKIYHQSLKL